MGNRRNTSHTVTLDKSETGKAARKQAAPRRDSAPELLKVCPHGWNYDEDRARALGSSEEGYYASDTTLVVLPPEDAYEIWLHHNYGGQRKQDDSWAVSLSESMVTAVNIAIAIGPSGKAFVVNGQHTLWAIYLRQRNTPASITIYQCRDDKAMASLYAIFDSNKTRTTMQVIHAAANAGALSYAGPEAKLARWAQCVWLAEQGYARKSVKQDNSTKVANAKRQDVQEFAQWMDQYVTESHHQRFIPQAIGAAFYSMFVSDRQNADKFAVDYFGGAGLDEDSPVMQMRNKMINRPKNQHAASASLELVQFMFSAWRKFCLKEPLSVLRRTLDVPEYNEWRIYETSQSQLLTLAGNRQLVKVSA